MHAVTGQKGNGVLAGEQEKALEVLQTFADITEWPTLEASPVAIAAAKRSAAPYLHALLANEKLPRGQQIQALSKVEV